MGPIMCSSRGPGNRLLIWMDFNITVMDRGAAALPDWLVLVFVYRHWLSQKKKKCNNHWLTVQSRTASVVHDHLDVCLGEKLQYFLRGHELLKRINVEPGGAQQMSNVSYCPELTGGLFSAARWDEAGTTLPLTLMLQLTAVAAGPVEPRQHRGHNIGAPLQGSTPEFHWTWAAFQFFTCRWWEHVLVLWIQGLMILMVTGQKNTDISVWSMDLLQFDSGS